MPILMNQNRNVDYFDINCRCCRTTKPANQVLVVAPLICVKYALKVPARSIRKIQNGGEVVKLYFETGPMLY